MNAKTRYFKKSLNKSKEILLNEKDRLKYYKSNEMSEFLQKWQEEIIVKTENEIKYLTEILLESEKKCVNF